MLLRCFSLMWILLALIACCHFSAGTHTTNRLRKHHRCVHDQLHIPVPTTYRSVLEYIPALPSPSTTATSSTSRRRLSKSNLRFHVEFAPELTTSSEAVFKRIVDDFIPVATTFWESALHVEQVKVLRFERNCESTLNFDDGTHVCHTYGSNMCGANVIPSSWLKGGETCKTCFVSGRSSCDSASCQSLPAGAGVPNKDFALFVSAVDSDTCKSSPDTLGYAHPCAYDQFDRPILGTINFCPAAMKTASDSVAITTSKHEIAHALGFTSETFPYMRWSDTLTPRTPRVQGHPENVNTLCADGNTRKKIRPGASTLWGPGTVRNFPRAFKLVTPNLAKAAQEHFGCTTETGVELENQPTGSASSCWGSHFEQRTLNQELMTPISDENSVVSQFTLAYFEDTGWYTPDYSKAETFYFGKEMGCNFLTEPCVSGVSGAGGSVAAVGSNKGYFCTDATSMSCTADKTSKAHCNLIDWSADLPVPFQYFSPDNKRAGGALAEMDYCPYYEAYSNGDCSKVANAKSDSSKNYYGEIYSLGSKCITANIIWDSYKPSESLTEICVGVHCNKEKTSATLTVVAEDGFPVSVVCASTDAGRQKNVNKFVGKITCPDVSVVCATGSVYVPAAVACPASLNNCNDPHGSCFYSNNKGDTYQCVCAKGWSGTTCETPPTPLTQNSPSPGKEAETVNELSGGSKTFVHPILVGVCSAALVFAMMQGTQLYC